MEGPCPLLQACIDVDNVKQGDGEDNDDNASNLSSDSDVDTKLKGKQDSGLDDDGVRGQLECWQMRELLKSLYSIYYNLSFIRLDRVLKSVKSQLIAEPLRVSYLL